MDDQDADPRQPRDGLGLAAVITGILLLSPVAIVLGHLSLRRSADDPRATRTLGLAGTILGYLGLIASIAGVALYLTVIQPSQSSGLADARAQADVTAVGNAVAAHFETDLAPPEVGVEDGSYSVGDATVDAQLDGERQATLIADSRIDWCVELSYDGGDDEVVSYVGSTGFQTGACGSDA
ncbi:DUF4190 domain-containing protein [Demequina zhanjiangensis]|uniref:DUF4190 domain-containing protein n=1 Tax=Demequina zhanjiangensis TaxID=3051659 RepID=A0ABT8G4E1_9MICO|nr:DUF4190 domain-containing protein [Demequina sp. SYSU T00b26]MDN4473973.1 DUF4190 domain-containing protein [Demequina sp. SYSU T00b26]